MKLIPVGFGSELVWWWIMIMVVLWGVLWSLVFILWDYFWASQYPNPNLILGGVLNRVLPIFRFQKISHFESKWRHRMVTKFLIKFYVSRDLIIFRNTWPVILTENSRTVIEMHHFPENLTCKTFWNFHDLILVLKWENSILKHGNQNLCVFDDSGQTHRDFDF